MTTEIWREIESFQHACTESLSWYFQGVENVELLPFLDKEEQTQLRNKSKGLEALGASIKNCTECGLHVERDKVVFGTGKPLARLAIVGSAPTRADSQKGIPFTADAGVLLEKMVRAMDYTMEDIYLTQVVKCPAPMDRRVSPKEVDCCERFLKEELRLVEPTAIVAMGQIAAPNFIAF